MSVGTGIECINLKKAKYNRDIRLAKAAEASQLTVETQPVHADRNAYNARGNAGYAVERVQYSRSVDVPADDGITLKDIADVLKKEISSSWHTYRKNQMREKARAPHYITKNVKAKTAFPVSVIGYIVVFSFIAMFLVLGNSRINEATLYADSLENQISKAMNKCEMLTAEVNSRNDAASVESYALDVLGLVRKTDVAKTYVSISGEDKVVVCGISDDTSERGAVTMTLDSGN